VLAPVDLVDEAGAVDRFVVAARRPGPGAGCDGCSLRNRCSTQR
jgi:hypothetical protein